MCMGSLFQISSQQASNLPKNKFFISYFTPRNKHAIPLFIKSTILPVTKIYFETITNLMHDISHTCLHHHLLKHNTRSAAKGNFSVFNVLSAEDDYVEINKIIDFLKSLA